AISNLAQAFARGGQVRGAAETAQRAVELAPTSGSVYQPAAGAALDSGEIEQALSLYRRAVETDPKFVEGWDNYLMALYYDARTDAATIMREHRRYGQVVRSLRGEAPARLEPNRDRNRRLRIGYVSGDFRDHSIAFFIEPILM